MFNLNVGDISHAIPDAWKVNGHARAVYSGYHCLSPESPSLKSGWLVDLGDAVVFAVWGECQYFDNLHKPKLDFNADGALQFTPVSRGQVSTEKQANIIILQRVLAGQEHNDPYFEDARKAICGLLSVNFSGSVTYSQLFVNFIDTKKRELGAFVGTLNVKSALLFQPIFSQERADHTAKVYDAILRKKELGHRYLRALHWYDIGHRSTDSLDAFINIWIGIEALVLNQQSNIYPLKKSIGDAYGLSVEKANSFFGIGRIFNIRSDLFHGQDRPQVSILFVEYLEALFADILHQELSLKCEERAKIFLNGKNFDQSGLV
ncbi:HEPN domain-containing protein [Achromobacter insuavis]|uniref:HEPN domain-containing protein n=1 Tax=Achromobacter insuavis TaxID=1287735 RepID=UPI0013C2B22A|nr:HEPN domain-containing protein [Achromobacter insuavis]